MPAVSVSAGNSRSTDRLASYVPRQPNPLFTAKRLHRQSARAVKSHAMSRRVRKLNRRNLTEPLEHTDPEALFELVRLAEHLGMWRGYEIDRSDYSMSRPGVPMADHECYIQGR